MAAAISRECVIDRSIGPAWTRSANAAVRPDSRTPGFGRPTISISFHVKRTPQPSAFPTASLPGEPSRVALRRTRARVAVLPFRVREAPLAKSRAGERTLDALDLDDVDPDLHGAQPPVRSSSSNAGK